MTLIDMRSLTRERRHDRRVRVIQLRLAGQSYDQIAAQTGLSRTGVFDICKRHAALGASGLHDAPAGRKVGEGRTLTRRQESWLQALIVETTPDGLALPATLWTRSAVGGLIEQRLGIRLPPRTLDAYLARWGFTPFRPLPRRGDAMSAAQSRWLIDGYPGIAAQSRAQDGEINWAGKHEIAGEAVRAASAAPAAKGPETRSPDHRPSLSMISSVTNADHLRWDTFVGVLDAPALIDFLRRLVTGARKKVFLIMDDLHVPDARSVGQWLAEHEDDIQAFDLPVGPPERAP